MKRNVLFLGLLLLLFGCSSKIILPKGQYQTTPTIYTTNKPIDSVWDKLVDLFAQSGLSIKIIDKTSGLITSGEYEIPAGYENKSGEINDLNAYIVIPIRKNIATGKFEPITGIATGPYAVHTLANPVYGEWNVRIKKSDTGGTVVNINLVNLHYFAGNAKLRLIGYKSTGVFEKKIFDIIK